jgi:hypothetical protein
MSSITSGFVGGLFLGSGFYYFLKSQATNDFQSFGSSIRYIDAQLHELLPMTYQSDVKPILFYNLVKVNISRTETARYSFNVKQGSIELE